MSKKNKAKFKKQIKAQISQEMNQIHAAEKPVFTATPTPQVSRMVPSSNQAAAIPVQNEVIANLGQIKKDLIKTAIIVGTLGVIIAVLAILDSKYGILLNFGDSFFKVLHIQ